MSNFELVHIVAVDLNNGIGKDNHLPWRLPEDLMRFKQITTGSAVIMGRKTYESIGKPLPNRLSLVMTRDRFWGEKNNVKTFLDIDKAISYARELGYNTAFIAGGGEIYKQTIDQCHRVELTRIFETFDCDTSYPELPDAFKLKETQIHTNPNQNHRFAFETYVRVKE